MKRPKTVQVPHDGDAGIRKRVAEVWARWVGRGDDLSLPEGWVQFGVDAEGRPLYGYIGPRNPQLELLAEALRKRSGR